MTHSHITEAKIIDLINRELSADEEKRVVTHLYYCKECQKVYHFWHKTIHNTTAVPFDQQVEIWDKVETRIKKKVIRRNILSVSLKGIGLTACCLLFFTIGLKFGDTNTPEQPSSPEKSFVVDNSTLVYDLVHTTSGTNKGYAWYNPKQKEVVLYINDQYNHDYSYIAIIETEYDIMDEQPIQLSNSRAQLYFQDEKLHHLNRIILADPLNKNEFNSYEFQIIPDMTTIWNK
jgi:hypothetical protein